jgi:hypothetical protein
VVVLHGNGCPSPIRPFLIVRGATKQELIENAIELEEKQKGCYFPHVGATLKSNSNRENKRLRIF